MTPKFWSPQIVYFLQIQKNFWKKADFEQEKFEVSYFKIWQGDPQIFLDSEGDNRPKKAVLAQLIMKLTIAVAVVELLRVGQ